MASNSSLICAGLWMSSSLEDKGWEEARASMANTRWTSPSTIRSFCGGTFHTQLIKFQLKHLQSSCLSGTLPPLLNVFCKRYSYHAPVRFSAVCTLVFNVWRKAFVQPQVIPPSQSNQITKPLIEQLEKMCLHIDTKGFLDCKLAGGVEIDRWHGNLTMWASSWPMIVAILSLLELEENFSS